MDDASRFPSTRTNELSFKYGNIFSGVMAVQADMSAIVVKRSPFSFRTAKYLQRVQWVCEVLVVVVVWRDGGGILKQGQKVPAQRLSLRRGGVLLQYNKTFCALCGKRRKERGRRRVRERERRRERYREIDR